MQRQTSFRHFIVWFFPLLLIAISVRCVTSGSDPTYLSDEVRASIEARIANAESVGMVVGVVDPEGKREYICCGTAGLEDPRPVDEHSVYEIGSISKVFTGTVLADMVEKEALDLSDPAEKFLPEGIILPSRNGLKITLEHLATHTSSLPRMPSNFKPSDPLNPYADYTVQDLYDFLPECTLTRDIGSQYEYSNLAVGLLGHILSLKAGKSYEEMIKERICRPLGMESTSITLTPGMEKRLARPHNAKGEVSLWDIPTLAGAGAIRSTAEDMLTFLSANMGLTKTDLLPAMKVAHDPRADAGENMKVGLCWHIRNAGQSQIVWHNGGTGGYRTFVGFDEAKKLGVVVLSNMSIGHDDIGFHVLDNSIELKKIKDILTLAPEILERSAGEFKVMESGDIHRVKRREGVLTLKSPGQRPVILFPKSETEFNIKFSTMRISFEADASGKIVKMIMHEPGKKTEAIRIK